MVRAVIAGTLLVVFGGLWAQEKQLEFKDRAEYDLYEQIRKETNGNTLLGLLDQWKQKYPDSQFTEARLQLYVTAYQTLRDAKRMLEAAKELVAEYPKNFTGWYWLTQLAVSMNDTSPAALDQGEKSAHGLLGVLDAKPAGVSDEKWKEVRTASEVEAHKTLGWIAVARKNWDVAEQEYTKVLQITPTDGRVSYSLGSAILFEKKFEKQSAGLFHICHAAMYDGPGAAPAEQRSAYKAFVQKTYVSFHGDNSGLDEMMAQCKAQTFPPEGFKIESKEELIAKKQQEMEKAHPDLALWMNLKKTLTGPEGRVFFEEHMKEHAIPGGVEVGGTSVEKLRGTIISTKAPNKIAKTTKEIVVGILSKQDPEVTLRFDEPVLIKAEPGAEIAFEGVPVEFTQDPFNVTIDVALDKLVGVERLAAPRPPALAPKKPAAPATKK